MWVLSYIKSLLVRICIISSNKILVCFSNKVCLIRSKCSYINLAQMWKVYCLAFAEHQAMQEGNCDK